VTLVKEGNHTGEPTTWEKKFGDGELFLTFKIFYERLDYFRLNREWFDYVQNLLRSEILAEGCRALKPVGVKKN